MAEYPDNSHNARERKQDGANPPDKKLEKIVNGETRIHKKNDVRKFANIFFPDDIENAKNYILVDIIVPGIKNALADALSIILFGEAGHIGGRREKGSSALYRYDDRRDDRRDYARPRSAIGFDYDDIVFKDRGDATLVLDRLESAIANYGLASVADLYDLAGMTCRSYMANKYGWTDIRTAKVIRTHDGYILQLPRTVQIN